MKKLISLLPVIFVVTNIFGQTKLPPPYEITTDTIFHNISLPDSKWQMIADPSGKITFQQILQSGQFQDTDKKINYHIRAYWLRYRFINKMQKEAEIAVDASGMARVDLYLQSEDGSWQHLKSGKDVSWGKRDGLKRAMFIKLTIPAGKEIMVYQRDYFNYLFNSPTPMEGVHFSFTKNVIQQQYVDNTAFYKQIILNSFLLGLILLAIIINLYFFRIVREKEFSYFILFLLGMALQVIAGLNADTISVYPLLSLFIYYIGNIVTFFFFMQFFRHFLKTFSRFPRWDKYLIAVSILFILGFSFSVFGNAVFKANLLRLFWLAPGLPALLYLVFILIMLFFYARKHGMAPKLLALAILPYLCVLLVGLVLELAVIYYSKEAPLSAIQSEVSSLNNFIQLYFEIGVTLSFIWLIVIFSWVLFLRFSMLRKKLALQEVEKEKERSALIAQQKIELEKQVTERTSELKQSLENLKSTQNQLIQSEKMASLGELTAGIAHEIQNPLNFVNNFSEVSTELVDEMKEELAKSKYEDANAIADDLKQNLEKINHHGKRAGDIVKGMLQHSRKSEGKKEPTDINALCDEYLRLAYHGLRAKDKSFNAEFKTDFDSSLPKIDVVPQDIGRVILNLINNAFYAVSEKQKQGIAGYEPTVWVSTKKEGNKILILIKDNGQGIPSAIKEKIFQPFFTTKPTGSGTGLGLSLSYDIIKAHGGGIKVETKEGEGTEFMIQLPFA